MWSFCMLLQLSGCLQDPKAVQTGSVAQAVPDVHHKVLAGLDWTVWLFWEDDSEWLHAEYGECRLWIGPRQRWLACLPVDSATLACCWARILSSSSPSSLPDLLPRFKVLNYKLFDCNNFSIRYWSWNHCGCWH